MGSKPEYWNHNTACYPWVARQLAGCSHILDVGCGDGSLVRFLERGGRRIVGVDASEDCIRTARAQGGEYIAARFEDFAPEEPFDGVAFVASLHHMEPRAALERAKELLAPGGVLVVVGLAHPSSLMDWIVEALRVAPSWIISKLHHMQTCEDNGVPVCLETGSMDEVRRLARELLPGARIRCALHYRYLLRWKKP